MHELYTRLTTLFEHGWRPLHLPLMTVLSIPRSLLWLAYGILIVLALMMLYRLITITLFSPEFGTASIAEVITLGLRYDLRYASLFALPLLLLFLTRPFHPFKSRTGKTVALVAFALLMFQLTLMYGMDLAYQISFRERLRVSILKELLNGTEKADDYLHNAPWLIVFLIVGVTTWLYFMAMRALHNKLAHSRPNRTRFLRNFWNITALVLLVVAIYGRPFPPPLTGNRAKLLGNKEAFKAAINPYESLRIWRNFKK